MYEREDKVLKMIKKILLLNLFFAFFLSLSLHASAQMCIVKSEVDSTRQSTPGYGDSFRYYLNLLKYEDNCPIPIETLDLGYEPTQFKRMIMFDTPEWDLSQYGDDKFVRKIVISDPITINAAKKSVIGNYSNYAIGDSNVGNLYDDTTAEQYITADWGYTVLDFSSFAEKNTDDPNAEFTAMTCAADSKNVWFRRMVWIVPKGYTKSDIFKGC